MAHCFTLDEVVKPSPDGLRVDVNSVIFVVIVEAASQWRQDDSAGSAHGLSGKCGSQSAWSALDRKFDAAFVLCRRPQRVHTCRGLGWP